MPASTHSARLRSPSQLRSAYVHSKALSEHALQQRLQPRVLRALVRPAFVLAESGSNRSVGMRRCDVHGPIAALAAAAALALRPVRTPLKHAPLRPPAWARSCTFELTRPPGTHARTRAQVVWASADAIVDVVPVDLVANLLLVLFVTAPLAVHAPLR